ncbi:MAG TPA: glycosyl hydrolase [Kiritimatiellia bacterium]|nr:glycosyl hydrolase [Kiritimatiellia bacterium]
MFFVACFCGSAAGAGTLDEDFARPPDTARCRTWWHWQDGCINPAMMEKELDALARAGFGGVQMFVGGNCRIPKEEPRTPFLNEDWMKAVRRALVRSAAHGFDFGFQNGAGWTGVGGPWMTTTNAMKHVFCVEKRVKGGEEAVLPKLADWPIERDPYWNYLHNPWYGDIRAFAFPTPPAMLAPDLPLPALAASCDAPNLTNLHLRATYNIYGREKYPAALKYEKRENERDKADPWITFTFPEPVTVRTIAIKSSTMGDEIPSDAPYVWASDDGRDFRFVAHLETGTAMAEDWFTSQEHPIEPTRAKVFKFTWETPCHLELREVHFSSRPSLTALQSQTGAATWNIATRRFIAEEAGTVVDPKDLIDVTSHIGVDGTLRYTPPADGRTWTVLRVGATSTRRCNQPSPRDATGPACDLLDADAIRFHLSQYAQRILDEEKAAGVKTVRSLLLDSWEQGTQNWSANLPAEFERRRGYALWNYLPIYAGYLVGSRDTSERYLWDARKTVNEVVCENFFGVVRDWCRERGLQHYMEGFACGVGTFAGDAMTAYFHCDVPMTEASCTMREAPSAAHLRGLPIVAVEAHTSAADWSVTPRDLKRREDAFFRAGMTRLIYHSYGHNPMPERRFPGPTFAGYGVALQLGQTWWEMARPWQEYLARCQALLQRGAFVADVLAFSGETYGGRITGLYGPGCDGGMYSSDKLRGLPPGFDFDVVNADFLVKHIEVFPDGTLGAKDCPGGTRYRVLVLRPEDKYMSIEVARKVRDLVKAGAAVVGPKPVCSLGLSRAVENDAEVRAIAAEVWNGGRYGKGRAIETCSPDTGNSKNQHSAAVAVKSLGLKPDFVAKGAELVTQLSYLHRREGDVDIYFVCRWRKVPAGAEMGFRVTGKRPEIFDPLTGRTYVAKNFREEDGYTWLPAIEGSASEASRFVVFRNSSSTAPAGVQRPNEGVRTEFPVTCGDWKIHFKDAFGVDRTVVTNGLFDWTDSADEAIRTFSGIATYRTTLTLPSAALGEKPGARFLLALGTVDELAEVFLNGQSCGIAWCEPYEVDITAMLKRSAGSASGRPAAILNIEVRVANAWLNRMLADMQKPEAERKTWTQRMPLPDAKPEPSGLKGPLTLVRVEE